MVDYMAKEAAKKENPVLFLIHRQELLEQIQQTIGTRNELIQLASVQTIVRRLHKTRPPKLIISDECFVAGTMIDNKPIELLQVGDNVSCFNEITRETKLSKVTHVFKNRAPSKLFGIKCEGAKEIVCTGNHPVFTLDGWVNADKLKEGDLVYADMSKMWRGYEKRKSPEVPRLLPLRYGGKKSERFAGKDAEAQSNVDARNQRKGNGNASRNWPQATCQGRKRYWAVSATTNIGGNTRVDDGTRHTNKNAKRDGLSNLLQGGYCQSGIKNCHRSRRIQSQLPKTSSARQKENSLLAITRVDHIKVYEQGSDGEFARVCPGGYIYNVEVETYGTYFANGIAVHNCHHGMANTWKKIFDYFSDACLVGLTATPARLGGQGLSEIFDKLIIGPSAKELIAAGYLAPYKYYAPPAVVDMDGVKIERGDFNSTETAIRMDKPSVTGDAISHYLRIAAGKRAIVYCASIQHSKNTAEAFTAAGVPAAHIDGETPKAERKQAIEDFRAGRITVLTNVDLFGEGLDVPGMEAVILLRPTASLTLYIQQSMRPMRPDKNNPFKTAIILDHVGNCFRHGLPDDEREWSLEGIRKLRKSDPSTVQIRTCEKCYSVFPPSTACPYCGHEIPIKSRDLEQSDGELKEITAIEKKKARMQVGMCRSMMELAEIAIERGYQKGWVMNQCKVKHIHFDWKELNKVWQEIKSKTGGQIYEF